MKLFDILILQLVFKMIEEEAIIIAIKWVRRGGLYLFEYTFNCLSELGNGKIFSQDITHGLLDIPKVSEIIGN